MNPPTIELVHGTVRTVVQTFWDDGAYIQGSNWRAMFAPKSSCLGSSFRKFAIPESLIDDFQEVIYHHACEGDLGGTIEVSDLHEDDDGNDVELDYEIEWKASGPLREEDIEEDID